MYSHAVVKKFLHDRAGELGFEPVFHSIPEVIQANKQLEELFDAENGRWRRALRYDEQRWVDNETAVCQASFAYWASRYAFIRSWDDRLIRFNPNIAQRVLSDVWGQMQDEECAIAIMELKARQLGVSTLVELAVAHRIQFWPNVIAIVGSSDPEKSAKMAKMMELCWQMQPRWLVPAITKYKAGELIEFGRLNSSVSIQHGTQKSGIARGDTPTVVHLSEIPDYSHPEELIDASLLRAMHESPWMFLVLESTAKGRGNWWHYTWNLSKAGWPKRRSRLRPIFLPWFVGRDIYPTETWLRAHPVPADYVPDKATEEHARRAQEEVAVNDLLRRYLGSTWTMPIEQKWFWEIDRAEAKAKKELAQFYCVGGDTLISTEQGIIPISKAQNVSAVETGSVSGWISHGKKAVVRLRTRQGRELVCTPDHRLMTKDRGWISAQDLLPSDSLVLSKPCFPSEQFVAQWQYMPGCRMSVPVDEHWARFLGYFLGDGNWGTDSVEIACAARDEDTIRDVCHIIERILGCPPRLQHVRGLTRVRSSNVRWWEVLWNLGVLDRVVSKRQQRNSGYRKKVRVPECIWKSPRHIVRQFLRGLFEADGSSATKAVQVGFFTKSPEFMREVQLLLLGFGINSQTCEQIKTHSDGQYTGRKLWLNAEATELFHREIGFVSGRKNSGLQRAQGQNARGRKRLANLMEDRVESVAPMGEADVYDICVPGPHSFGANGILAANSEMPANDEEAFQSSNISVFDVDLIAEYRQHTKKPLGVFAVIGSGVTSRISPAKADIDPTRPRINITAAWRENGFPLKFQLVPLKWQGYDTDDGLDKLYIWEPPLIGEEYGLGVDLCDGVGADRSTIEVLRKGTFTKNDAQVAEFTSPFLNSMDMWPICMAVATLYSVPFGESVRQPRVAIECRTSGENCELEMRKAGWRNFHQWTRYDTKRINPAKSNRLGWFTVSWSRDLLMDRMIKYLRDGAIDIFSPWFIDEMSDLERDETRQRMKIMAGEGSFDDRFMAMGMILVSLHILEFRGYRQEDAFQRIGVPAAERNDQPDVYQPDYARGMVIPRT